MIHTRIQKKGSKVKSPQKVQEAFKRLFNAEDKSLIPQLQKRSPVVKPGDTNESRQNEYMRINGINLTVYYIIEKGTQSSSGNIDIEMHIKIAKNHKGHLLIITNDQIQFQYNWIVLIVHISTLKNKNLSLTQHLLIID